MNDSELRLKQENENLRARLQEAEESEERYRRLADNAKDMVYRMSLPDGSYEFVSKASEELFGYSPDEFYSTPILIKNAIHPDSAEYFKKEWEKLIRGEMPSAYEYQIIHKYKGVRWLHQRNTLVRDKGGKVIAIEGIATDITDRKKHEERLKENQEELLYIQRLAKSGPWQWDIKKNKVAWTDEVFRIYGLSPQPNFTYEKLLQCVHPDDRVYHNENTSRWLETKECKPFNYRIIMPDGEIKYIRAIGDIEFDERGEPVRMFGSLQDVTDLKLTEEQLKYFELIVNTSEDLMAIVDDQYIYRTVSSAYGRYFNKPAQSIIGTHISFLTGDESFNSVFKPNLEQAFSGEKVKYEGWVDFPRRGKRFMVARYYPVKDKAGKAINIVCNIRDVTERKKLEDQLIQAQKMESIGRLAGGIAHDFNNMLSIINGYSDLALEKLNPHDPIYDDLLEIQKAGLRSKDLTRQLLAFARKQIVSPKVLDLNNLIKKSDTMMQRLIGEDITIHLSLSPDLWPIKIDPSQVDQTFVNLAVNSRDAISGVGEITIETSNTIIDQEYCYEKPGFIPGQFVMLAFSDNGAGMTKEIQSQIFEPFYTTKGTSKGTGLGLSTIYGIVKQNNGFINVYSEPDHGTTFRVYLPRHKGEIAEDISTAKPTSPEGNETVLVVEDEEQILLLCKRTLESKGYNVMAASKPGEAIILCEKATDPVDLLITDVVMPTMNGKELMNRVKELIPDIRVLFMSGYTANVIAHRGVLSEGMNFMQKPFSPKDLLLKVRELIDSN